MSPESATTPHGLNFLDWVVVVFCAVGMLAIGWYYSRRAKMADDYLLGGRTMRP